MTRIEDDGRVSPGFLFGENRVAFGNDSLVLKLFVHLPPAPGNLQLLRHPVGPSVQVQLEPGVDFLKDRVGRRPGPTHARALTD